MNTGGERGFMGHSPESHAAHAGTSHGVRHSIKYDCSGRGLYKMVRAFFRLKSVTQPTRLQREVHGRNSRVDTCPANHVGVPEHGSW